MTDQDGLHGATHLECTGTGEKVESEKLIGLSAAGKPLFARYDMDLISSSFTRESVACRSADLWRYQEVLPVRNRGYQIRLGEGWTPLIDAHRTANRMGIRRVWVKDEGQNPTGSFKDRGLCLAVSRALELGAEEVAIPSAGNAGSAAAAYAAAAGLRAHVVVPTDTPAAILEEISALGADLQLLDGLISDCGLVVRQGVEEHGWFDLSTLKEPYRVEGKKTMGYELCEQLGWRLPDAIVYPTGGGTGLIGMWKAFDEMEQLGWIDGRRPRMYAVQSDGCAPIVRAFANGDEFATPWEDADTFAAGIRVPGAIGDYLILRAIRESQGSALAVSDHSILSMMKTVASSEGMFICPEGAATAVALAEFMAEGSIDSNERVLLLNTGSGLKYLDLLGDIQSNLKGDSE